MVFEKLSQLIAEHFSIDVEDITMDTHFVEDLNADSIDLMELMMAAEETFGGSGVTVIPQDKTSEASAALAVLGYNPAEINAALKGLDLDALTLEEIVRQALRKMVK